ncbi:MAG: M3 family metallopeptidase [Bacteroidales bacterium]|nr:M3 family metallopeptidase [Bacteroidales bacterium]MCF8337780.1 M3 family metallopeptidase [Bacteroidales bacterium]
MKNPLLSEFETPFEVPPFDQIEESHFMPAFEKGMEQQNKAIKAIINSKEEPDFENTIAAMTRSGELLDRVSSIFYGLESANTNDSLQSIAKKISPKLSKHRDEISLNPELFKKVKHVYDKRKELELTSEQAYILENVYKRFIRSGANLPEKKQQKVKEINQRLSALTLEFGQNVLAETNNYEMVLEDEEKLSGLPESVIQTAKETAEKRGYEGKWVFTTQKTSMIPFLQYSKKRNLRKKLFMAYTHRGNNDNEHDNKDILKEIVNLRARRANLLGYNSHADYRLETRMAKKPGNVNDLLERVWDAALPVAKEEREEMQQMIEEEGKDFDLQSWDWWYYAEKIRKQKYDLDDSDLRPYFQLENVREGAFMTANKLYGITFNRIDNIPTPHPDAQAFKVNDHDGSHLGVLYMDFHPRSSKRGGAWCGDYRGHKRDDAGNEVQPVTTIVCNFTRPTADKPSLLSLDEVETLFHEFGHALDGLFAENTYPETFVARDFVELPSQIMEHWATKPRMLKKYAQHYKTGEEIPESLIDKIEKSTYFNQGFANVEFIAASMLDMAYHTFSEPKGNLNVMEFEKKFLNEAGLIPEIEPRYHSTYFRHITGGYDAGYYSYLWSAVLDNDAFEAFEKNGLFDEKTAAKFRKNILEKNGIADPKKLYKRFRGREPRVEPLLRNRGLLN